MNNFYFICNYREQFPTLINGSKVYNDHISQVALTTLINTFNQCGYPTKYFGGVEKLIECYYKKIPMPEGIYVNLNDGLEEKHKRGQTPILLELLHIPFTGSEAFNALLASDKFFTKAALHNIGVKSAPSILIRKGESPKHLNELNYPVIVKPNTEGSSLGIDANSFCSNETDARKKALTLCQEFGDVLIEEYIEGYEATDLIISNKHTGNVLLNEVLCITLGDKVKFSSEIIGIKEKASGARKYHLPEKYLSSAMIKKIKSISEQIIKYLGLPNFVRLDFRIRKNEVFFLEVNTNPAFGITSDVGRLCELKNMTFKQFVEIFIASCNP